MFSFKFSEDQSSKSRSKTKSKSKSKSSTSYIPKNEVHHLILQTFKINKCTHEYTHNHKKCNFYHNEKDKKRNGEFYSSQMCEYVEKGKNCPNGDKCKNSHNSVEQLFREEKYKTKFCSYYPFNLRNCDYGKFCCFAHSEEDIKIELIHNYATDNDFYMFYFKTIWCPFNLKSHEKSRCVYAHNWQDFRRSPAKFQYSPTPCLQWDTNEFISSYQVGCKNGLDCEFSHGWKESEYHPLIYKTKPCSKCIKGNECSYFHSNFDKRVIAKGIESNIFDIVPKNRTIKQASSMKETTATEGNHKMASGTEFNTDYFLPAENNEPAKIPLNEELRKRHSYQPRVSITTLLEQVDRRHSANEAAGFKPKLFGVGFSKRGSENKIKEVNLEDEEEMSESDDSMSNV